MTYTLIDSVTLGSGVTSFSFTSVPQDFRDLVLVSEITAVGDFGTTYIRFNSDSGANYNRVRMTGDGSSTASAAVSNGTQIVLYSDQSVPAAGETQLGVTNIMDYSATDKHKSLLARLNNAVRGVDAHAYRWASTSAITSLDFSNPNGATWAAGSTFYLYGIEA